MVFFFDKSNNNRHKRPPPGETKTSKIGTYEGTIKSLTSVVGEIGVIMHPVGLQRLGYLTGAL
jgi:hypothetical protein